VYLALAALKTFVSGDILLKIVGSLDENERAMLNFIA